MTGDIQIMNEHKRKTMQGAARAALAAVLCGLMAAPQTVWAEGVPTAGHPAALTPQQKTLHALNRLTFGPRPGDEAAVSRVGLEAWFQRQLHPERIDDSAFEARLQQFPAMQLSSGELMQRFPSPQLIRQMQKTGAALPNSPTERAIYADYEAQYDARVKNDAAGVPQAKPGAGMEDDAMMQPQKADANAAAGESALAETGQPVGKTQLMSDGSMQASGDEAAAGAAKNRKRDRAAMEPADVEAVLALAPDARMQRLIAMPPQEMMAFQAGLRIQERPRLMQGLTPAQMEIVAAFQGPVRVVGAEALESRLLRDVLSERQLQAVMSDFWLNHFSVYVRKNQNEPYYLPSYQNQVILPNSLGKFEDLLLATAKSPAMLLYLDNWESIGPDSPAASVVARVQKARPNGALAQALPKGINENYARELMELHTLGVGGGYTQKDVIEVAKCFTGWTIERPYAGGGARRVRYGEQDNAQPGEFVFMASRHEPGSKTVLGHVIPEGGMNEGLEVLHILATSPATAHFVSQKLAVRFVSDTPQPALVDRMAATFLKTDGNISAVLTTMFHSPEFWAPEVYRAKVKTPIEFLASALRASDATVQNPLPLVQAMERLGMPVYGMQTPNGYSWMSSEWVSSNALISRMNFALVLSGDRLPGTQTNWLALLGDSGNLSTVSSPTPATEKQLETLLLGQPATARTRQTVLEQFSNPTAQQQAEQSFNARKTEPVTGEPDTAQASQDIFGNGKLLRTSGRKGARDFQNNQPASPLDTMAGLLLGSPDFQRR
jgi:uncharacterized protein (DUF1800 family)